MSTSRAGARRQNYSGGGKRKNGKSELEAAFLYYWRIAAPGLPEPVAQHKFHPSRRWRLDFAWPDYKVSVEINGAGGGGYGNPIICHACGARVRARLAGGALGKELRLGDPSHSSADGQKRDAEKSNALTLAGWRQFVFTSTMLRDDPHGCVSIISGVLREMLQFE